MSDIRLKEMPFEYGGKTYPLRCNMNVLADVQEACGGNISTALRGKSGLKSALQFLAAMMNDYADEQGWPERFTARQLGRSLNLGEFDASGILALVVAELTPDRNNAQTEEPAQAGEAPGEEDPEKN